jgi:hypothetical protein
LPLGAILSFASGPRRRAERCRKRARCPREDSALLSGDLIRIRLERVGEPPRARLPWLLTARPPQRLGLFAAHRDRNNLAADAWPCHQSQRAEGIVGRLPVRHHAPSKVVIQERCWDEGTKRGGAMKTGLQFAYPLTRPTPDGSEIWCQAS